MAHSSDILCKNYFHDELCALRVNCKRSDLIGRATFQSLGQLIVHNVTRPLFRVHFRGLGHETSISGMGVTS